MLKIGFIFANNNDLVFLLKPTNKLIEFFTNSNSQLSPWRKRIKSYKYFNELAQYIYTLPV